MEASEQSPFLVSCEITASRCQLMGPSFHHRSDGIALKPKTYGCHFSDSIASVDHMFSPAFDCVFELREIFRDLILSNILHDVSDVIEVSPFSIIRRRRRSEGFVSVDVGAHDISVIAGLFCEFGCGSDLEVIFWEDVRDRPAGVEIERPFVEELFHHVQKLVVLFRIDSGVLDDEAAVGMERICLGFAVLSVVTRFCEERLDINDRDGECGAEHPSDSLQFEHST